MRRFRALPETRLFPGHPNWDWRPFFCTLEMGLIEPRAAVLRDLLRQSGWKVTAEVADAALAQLGIPRSTLFRAVARFRRTRRASSLLPLKRGTRDGSLLLDPRIERIIEEQIERFWLKKEKPRFSALMERVHDAARGCVCCCGCGPVGNAEALSIMSTALTPAVAPRQTAIGERSASARQNDTSIVFDSRHASTARDAQSKSPPDRESPARSECR